MSAIAVQHLSVTLGGLPIIQDLTFAIGEGETVGLLGANGSGKTTLVKALLGLTRHEGTVTLLGTPLDRFTAWDEIGYVPQRASVSLHSTTVAEVVASGTLARRPLGWYGGRQRARVTQALTAVGLAGHEDELYLHLSGGQQQRVLIARGIVNRPRLIIMDEPFAGVDVASQTQIAAAIAGYSATLLVVLHETDALEAALTRTLVLAAGTLAYDGAPAPAPDAHGLHETAAPERTRLLSGMEPRWTS
ncbi:MAG: ATP-binding cassette domain-containing protein [Propionibacteriaceae bacterium]|jgi:zinc transport system ATP-binding protein|nr:ATP-binding cassette domain-containing protein [Propionibacteriaceae bacterium]